MNSEKQSTNLQMTLREVNRVGEGKKNIPKLRFKGYEDAWEQRKLGSFADVTKLAGFEFTEHVVYSDSGKIIALRGLNVKEGKLVLNDVKYIDGSNFDKLNRSKLFKNDILFTYVGTVGDVAIIKENDRFYLAPNVARIRIQSNDSPIFVSHFMRNDNFYRQIILPLIATSSQPALSMENIRKFELYLPSSRKEQDKSAELFENLDKEITLHQRKYDALKTMKKTLLSKMFPKDGEDVPEIRFKGFTDAWEQRKLGDIAESTYGGGTPKTTVEEFWNGEIPWIQSSDIQEDQVFNVQVRKTITEKGLANSAAKLIPKNSIAIVTRVGVGKLGLIPFDFTTSQDFLSLSSLNIDSNFALYLLFKRLQFESKMAQGTSIKGITKEELLSKEVKIAHIDMEQKSIGYFFQNLDDIITLHQRKLDELKNMKKTLLQQMFV